MEKQDEKLVRYQVEAGVAVLTLANAPANCYTYELMKDLDDAILKARFDSEAHVIVITGEGEKFFCAGADIRMLESVTPNFKYYFCLHANETLNRLEQTPKLVIGALNGHAMGGGFEVAMACDLRIAKAGKSKFGLPEVNLGVLPGTGGTQRLIRLVGKNRAMEMMITGETFSAEQAKAEGMVHQVFEAEDFHTKVLEYAKGFCPPHKPSLAVGLIKRACQTGAELPFQDALALERELQQQLFTSQDAKEGLGAYTSKRTPAFQGL